MAPPETGIYLGIFIGGLACLIFPPVSIAVAGCTLWLYSVYKKYSFCSIDIRSYNYGS